MNLLVAENLSAVANAAYCGIALGWTRPMKQFADDQVPEGVGISINNKFFVDGNNPDKSSPVYGGWGITGIIPPFNVIGETSPAGKTFDIFIRSFKLKRDANGQLIINPTTHQYEWDLVNYADSSKITYVVPAGFSCSAPAPTITTKRPKK